MTKECTNFISNTAVSAKKPKSCDRSKHIKGKLTLFLSNSNLELQTSYLFPSNYQFLPALYHWAEHFRPNLNL